MFGMRQLRGWCVVAAAFGVAGGAQAAPKNVIVMIGDGLGFEHVRAAGIYLHGQRGTLVFESFPGQGELETHPAGEDVTDSAAAATAMATGFKVNNKVISTAIPGNGRELETLLEYFRDRGKSTGLVTTTYITHATPAAFGAHESHRDNHDEIAADYLEQTRPNVLFGGGGKGMTVDAARDAGYKVVHNAAQLASLNTNREDMVSGQFGFSHLPFELDGLGNLPHLTEMTATALDILDNDDDGFFLMVEGGRIDHAGHRNEIERAIHEIVEFDRTVQLVLDWADGRSDTLILVTADHETGGLDVVKNKGKGKYPDVTWSTDGHTAVNVPLFAWGARSNRIDGVLDNTEIWDVILSDPEDTTPPAMTCPGTKTRRTNGRCVYSGGIGQPSVSDDQTPAEEISVASDRPDDLPLGVTEVTWMATDEAGNESVCVQEVTVIDDDPPEILCPPAATLETGRGCGAVEWSDTATATDNCSPDELIVISHDAPDSFAVGVTEVTWIAVDEAGNESTCLQEVTLVDDEPPELECPPAVTIGADVACDAMEWIGTVAAEDNCSLQGDVELTHDAPDFLPTGVTEVTWRAIDGSGNASVCVQTVTVVDVTPPVLECPATTVVSCADSEGTPVRFEVSATDDCDPLPQVVCEPPSGALFPTGLTEVSCSVSDLAGNLEICSFDVVVQCGGFVLPGDCNSDGALDISDMVCLLTFLFVDSTVSLPCGSAGESRRRLLDWNGSDGFLDVSDVVGLAFWKFLAGPPHHLGSSCRPLIDCPDVCEPVATVD